MFKATMLVLRSFFAYRRLDIFLCWKLSFGLFVPLIFWLLWCTDVHWVNSISFVMFSNIWASDLFCLCQCLWTCIAFYRTILLFIQAFAQLLQGPVDDADLIIKERFPVPRLVVCDQHGSQVSCSKIQWWL